ncbi:MAG: hypothetical protein ACLQBY_01810 [Solirubrobacteraceae bacterium]
MDKSLSWRRPAATITSIVHPPTFPVPASASPRLQATSRRPRRLAARVAQGLWARAPWVSAGLAAAIPVINSTIKAVRAGWVPAGDDGIIATRGWDVLTSHTPLVGQYSEAGLVIHGQVMHSPGPMLYWLLALPARFGSVTSIAATMGVVNTLAIIGCVALARRRGGLILMLATAAGIALMCQSLPTEAMHDIWNPAAGLFPFLLLVFLGWSLACGEHRLLAITVLVASYVTQTHLMYAAPTAVLLAVGCGGLLIRSLKRRGARSAQRKPQPPPPPRIWPWALAALVVAAACWTEPAIDQIENNPGNLAMIVRTAEHRGPTLGATVGWHAVVRSVGARPWWLYVPASEWERKADVRATPSSGEANSTIALLVALALAGLVGAVRRRWDLAAAALIGLGLCAAIGIEAASNPSATLLAETLGYTMWWGSELGLWVWLMLAWALWLGLVGLSRPPLRALRRRVRADRRALPSWTGPVAAVLASLAGLGGVAAVGSAVAATAEPDSHVYEYRPIRAVAAGIERLIGPGRSIEYRFGPLDVGTQPMEPAIRFLLVRHGDRVMANGSFPRLGSYYELYDRPVQWTVHLRDGTRPQPHMTLAARVRFTDPWGREVLSAWVGKAQPRRRGSHT